MKLTLLRVIFLSVILLGLNCSVSAQQDLTDSIKGGFDVAELKAISKLLTELEFRRTKDSLSSIELNQYNEIVNSFIEEKKIWKQKEDFYKTLIIEVTPKWYEKPLFVSGATAIVLTSIFLLSK